MQKDKYQLTVDTASGVLPALVGAVDGGGVDLGKVFNQNESQAQCVAIQCVQF